MFRLYTTIFILFGQTYLFLRLRRYCEQQPALPFWSKKVLAVVFLIFNLPLIAFYFYFWQLSQLSETILLLLMPVFVWHIATLFIFLVLGIGSMIKLPFTLSLNVASYHPTIKQKVSEMKETPQFKKFDTSRRTFLRSGVVGLSAYSFIGASSGAASAGEYEIKKKTITIPQLPEEFKGFTIGILSDIHSSIFMNKEDMDKYVSAMNELKTDLVVVTGDFVNSQTDEVYPFAEAFSNLHSPHGVYGCLGNHDYFARDVERVAKEVDNCGVKLLRNDAVQIRKGNSYFNLVGVDDIGRNTPPEEYMTKALAFAKNDQPKILLCHKPYYFEKAKELGFDLTLSGHTHGGQIVFGTIDRTPLSLAALASKYVSGLYTIDQSLLYVNNGIGFTGIPFRINCPAELTVLTLA
ncbi:MAG: metallophosphoesterase [Bacteroidota bacterium]